MRVLRTLLVASVGGLAAAGCAGPDALPGHGSGPSAFDRSVRVIEGWSTALRTGHVQAAAGYFTVPAVFVNGPDEVLFLRSRRAVEIANRLLPCGAVYVSARRDGRYVNALFRLTDRPGPGGGPNGCGAGVGTTARVDFVIRDGKITHWLRAPNEPGDRGRAHLGPPHGGGTATSPGTSTGPGTSPGTSTGPVKPPGTATVPTPTVPAPQTTTTEATPKV
ncbi:MAG TPA: hypothetical protein VFW09_15720 [Solirubrobacteraceae bacterium]|nr:hypothetical protein [Solirubrobacteraceae bacterium]